MKVHIVNPDKYDITECGKVASKCEEVALTIASAAGHQGSICKACERKRMDRGTR